MLVISSAELRNNMKKYLDIAKYETVIIQRGKTETFTLSTHEYLAPDSDLKRAISMTELRDGVKEDLKNLYKAAKK